MKKVKQLLYSLSDLLLLFFFLFVCTVSFPKYVLFLSTVQCHNDSIKLLHIASGFLVLFVEK